MIGFGALFRREVGSYFSTPLALVFLIVFLVLSGIFTFYVGNFFLRGQADLQAFFTFHPWLYLFLAPALAMRLWAEEKRAGTMELLMTLPVAPMAAVAAKFLAAWTVAGLALALTFPLWITVTYLGEPDHGVIFASYVGSLLMLGAYLAIGSFASALTRNQVLAFVGGAALCFFFTVSGLPLVIGAFEGWAPQSLLTFFENVSLLKHFTAIQRGVFDARDLLYFSTVIAAFLGGTYVLVTAGKVRS
ncbi:MAG: ABC transporter permease subunit [Pseudomonadota bacterium]